MEGMAKRQYTPEREVPSTHDNSGGEIDVGDVF